VQQYSFVLNNLGVVKKVSGDVLMTLALTPRVTIEGSNIEYGTSKTVSSTVI